MKTFWLVVDGSHVGDLNWLGEYLLDTRGHRVELVPAFTPIMSSCAVKGSTGRVRQPRQL